jgi:hypothetical protein
MGPDAQGESMERTRLLGQFSSQVALLARRGVLRDALAASWPLPAGMAAHLWLYACGLVGPTRPPQGSR